MQAPSWGYGQPMNRLLLAFACSLALLFAGCGDDDDPPAPDRPPYAQPLPTDGDPRAQVPYESGQPAPDGVTDVVRPEQLR